MPCAAYNFGLLSRSLLCFIVWNPTAKKNVKPNKRAVSTKSMRCYYPTLEGLCVEAIFSSLFQPQFRAHEPGRKIADAASGHCHNSHTWPFGQEEVQLREFVSTLHVKPLSGPGNLAADEPHERSESCTTPSPTARLLWHLQRALHQAACHASACARCLNIA